MHTAGSSMHGSDHKNNHLLPKEDLKQSKPLEIKQKQEILLQNKKKQQELILDDNEDEDEELYNYDFKDFDDIKES
jgi:hypothetical protein